MERKEYVVCEPTETIREILSDKELTQKDLADQMGITRQNISQMLNRGTKAPRFDSVAKLVTALGCEIVVRSLEK